MSELQKYQNKLSRAIDKKFLSLSLDKKLEVLSKRKGAKQ